VGNGKVMKLGLKKVKMGDNLDGEFHTPDAIVSTYTKMVNQSGERSNFSKMNRDELLRHLKMVPDCKVILEIGVMSNEEAGLTSTRVLLDNKNPETVYIGVDLENKRFINDPSRNIHTIISPSEYVDSVKVFMKALGVEKIDFLFIDGWHSINQCILEWEGYVPLLSEHAIIGLHDTNHHLGPRWLIDHGVDKKVWEIFEFPGDPTADFGIAFFRRK
jgi:hypothetical protein